MADYSNMSKEELLAQLQLRDKTLQEQQNAQQQRNQVLQVRPAIPLPENWNLKSNDHAASFEAFLRGWRIYENATSLEVWDEKTKIGVFWSALGTSGVQKCLEEWAFTDADKASVATIVEKIQEKVKAQKIPMIERIRFSEITRDIDRNESLTEFVQKVEKAADYCGFGAAKDEMILHQVLRGMKDNVLQRELLSTRDLRWNDAKLKIKVKKECDEQLDVLNTVKKEPEAIKKIKAQSQDQCKYCGSRHKKEKGSCPAFGKQCNYCKGKNHFATVCLKKAKDKDSKDENPKKSYDKYKKKSENRNKCKKIEAEEESDFWESDGEVKEIRKINTNRSSGAFKVEIAN